MGGLKKKYCHFTLTLYKFIITDVNKINQLDLVLVYFLAAIYLNMAVSN